MSSLMFSPTQMGALKNAAKLQKAQSASNIIGLVGEGASMVVSTIFSAKNAKDRERMVEDLENIKQRDFQELDALLRKQKTQTERLNAYLMFFSDLKAKEQDEMIRGTIGGIASKKSMSEKRLMKIIFGGAIALIVIGLIIKKVRK
jgi:cobalamin biosynthesis Mg chelatase CobN